MGVNGTSGEALLAAGAALAICIARGHTADEVARLAALFTVLGDQLALLALDLPSDDRGGT